MLESRVIDSAEVSFSDADEEGSLASFLDGSKVFRAGALRWNYGLAADLRTRPTVGGMAVGEEDSAHQYFIETYGLKYGGRVE